MKNQSRVQTCSNLEHFSEERNRPFGTGTELHSQLRRRRRPAGIAPRVEPEARFPKKGAKLSLPLSHISSFWLRQRMQHVA
jgi:hypothetical protein